MIDVHYSVDHIAWCIYKYEKDFNGKRYYRDSKGNTVEVKKGERVEPMCIIEDMDELLEAISKAGLKPKSDWKLEGVLEATKDHLEDMRTLVFSAKKEKKTNSKGGSK